MSVSTGNPSHGGRRSPPPRCLPPSPCSSPASACRRRASRRCPARSSTSSPAASPAPRWRSSNPQQQSKYEIKSDANGALRVRRRAARQLRPHGGTHGICTVKREGVVLPGQAFQQNVTMQVGIAPGNDHGDDDGVRTVRRSTARESEPRVTPGKTQCRVHHARLAATFVRPRRLEDVRPVYPTGVKPGVVQLDGAHRRDGRVANIDVVGNIAGTADPVLADAAINGRSAGGNSRRRCWIASRSRCA